QSKGRLDGSLRACQASKASAVAPPEECGAALRVELHPILVAENGAAKSGGASAPEPPPAAKDAPSAEVVACPDGYHFAENICTRTAKERDTGYLCEEFDFENCKVQCAKGNGPSCYNAVVLDERDVAVP